MFWPIIAIQEINQNWKQCILYKTHRTFGNDFSSVFSHENVVLHIYYVLRVKQFKNNALLNILCVLQSNQCFQFWWIPCTIDDLKSIVNVFGRNVDTEIICKAYVSLLVLSFVKSARNERWSFWTSVVTRFLTSFCL